MPCGFQGPVAKCRTDFPLWPESPRRGRSPCQDWRQRVRSRGALGIRPETSIDERANDEVAAPE
eukprot:14907215-Alexandrium_andersonii.AAC.1